MREILFRGRTTDCGWKFGTFVSSYMERVPCQDGETRDLPNLAGPPHCGIVTDFGEIFVVERETVGQYTGLKDRNGQKIFEGDILLPPGEDAANLRLVVVFEKGCWTLRVPDWGWLFDTPLYEFGGEAYLILGNIHDNPELLKKEE